jgi:hypothetical protein
VTDQTGAFADFPISLEVTNVNDKPAGSLTIDDTTPTEGQLLTVINGITDADGTLTSDFIFQWQSFDGTSWVDIPNAVGGTFVPGNAQGGQMLRVVATYTDDDGQTETFEGTATEPVVNIPGAPLALLLDNNIRPARRLRTSRSTMTSATRIGSTCPIRGSRSSMVSSGWSPALLSTTPMSARCRSRPM